MPKELDMTERQNNKNNKILNKCKEKHTFSTFYPTNILNINRAVCPRLLCSPACETQPQSLETPIQWQT